jgi:predicted DNA-binding protein
MVKVSDGEKRITYSARLKPELVTRLKHLAVDENKAVSELIEEGILLVLQDREETRTR